VDPELAAYVTVKTVLSYAAGNRTVRAAGLGIAASLEAELVADGFEKANGTLYRAVVRGAAERGLSPERQGAAVGKANRHFNLVERPWTGKQKSFLGIKLVELAVESLGIVEAYVIREARTLTVHRLRFTDAIGAWLAQYNDAWGLTRPLFLPTVVPPKPWISTRDGGYHSKGSAGIRFSLLTKPFPGQVQAVGEAIADGSMTPHLTGLNGLQATPWRINKRVLAVMQEAWEKGLQGLPLPSREPDPKPEVPQTVIDDVKGGEHRKAWRRRMRDWHSADQVAKAHRFEFARSLAIAEEHAEYPAI
jgi:DNA-directed RNA polymerase